ncbi:hypothetical protein [Spirochaeta africana]|uniref:DUF304 domain-containing protein n=1 Tax=Spirochaeta africana (strain ATCC 700263 / DSM 8902 / Z-7692) TaxID=889378 RepID=H9UIA7_SPIAZ|nr:hypothetical protein [Spirochaeta africana]AFG37250.1 hypothetical protein Spiaf_1171 [Spirochaeta africana DSM 8902]
MFDLHLRMKPVKPDLLHIHIPLQFRWLFATLAILTAWVAISTGIWSPVAIGVLVLALLGLIYDERWIFDRVTGEVHYRIGFLFIGRHLVLAMRDIDHFEFRVVHQKGRELCQTVLWTTGLEPFLVESQPAAYRTLLLHEAELLAEFCGRPLSQP